MSYLVAKPRITFRIMPLVTTGEYL